MYSFKNVIQEGSYGRVLEVERDGVSYAVKEFFIGAKKLSFIGVIYLKEVDFLKRCQHLHILSPHSISYGIPFKGTPPHTVKGVIDAVYSIMPLAELSLYQFLRRDDCTVSVLKRIMLQITQALAYLHANDVCYRDVKSSNILVFEKDGVFDGILCDLGMCKPLTDGQINSDHIGTTSYKAPEVMMSKGAYSFPVDVWSLGILFFEMFNFKMPFERQAEGSTRRRQNMENPEIITKIFHNRGSPSLKLFNKLSGGGVTVIAFEKVSKWSPKPISKLFNPSSKFITEFDSFAEPGVEVISSDKEVKCSPNFGTLVQYEALLERILKIDPDERPSMQEILNDDFFSAVPEVADPAWFGLCRAPVRKEPSHVLRKISDNDIRTIGLKVIGTMIDFYPDTVIVWRCQFLALDIYDRCLLKLEELDQLASTNIQLLAYCCSYIACKYFLDESTPDVKLIFLKLNFPKDQIISMEKTILIELLDWRIYRPTIYDILKVKLKPEILIKVLMDKPKFYESNKTVDELAKIYVEELSK